IRLPDDIIPAEHRDTHRNILTMRDKHFAHTDLDFQTSPLIIAPDELLVVLATRAGLIYGIGSLIPAQSTVEDYRTVLDDVIDKVTYRSEMIAKRWSSHLKNC